MRVESIFKLLSSDGIFVSIVGVLMLRRTKQQMGTYPDLALELQYENQSLNFLPSPQLFLPGIIRSIDWFVLGKETRARSPAEEPPLQRAIVRNKNVPVSN